MRTAEELTDGVSKGLCSLLGLSHLKPEERELIAAAIRSAQEEGSLALSRLLDEHPEGWDGPCECGTCLSYGDLETPDHD